jgi:hypothetical protein
MVELGLKVKKMKLARIILVLAVLTVAGEARAREFGGHDCLDDCSGHAAGYRWAEAQAITDETDCPPSRILTVAPTRMMTETRSTDPFRGALVRQRLVSHHP